MLLLAALGLIAGILTTIAGMGGGLFLVAVLTVLHGPHLALTLTTPALFVSNGHRAYLFRGEVDRNVAASVAIGAVPGAIVGGLVLPALPELFVTLLLVAVTVVALLRAWGAVKLRLRARSLAMAGAGVGAMAATSGGAGMLIGPVVLSTGLTGAAYVGTVAACAVAMHLGRILGYGAAGLLTIELLPSIAALLVGLLAGNLVGRRARGHIPKSVEPRIEIGALVVSTAMAVVGLAR